MPNNKKQERKTSAKSQKVIVTEKVDNYENHPFFVKKLAQAKEFLERADLTKQLINK